MRRSWARLGSLALSVGQEPHGAGLPREKSLCPDLTWSRLEAFIVFCLGRDDLG